MKDEDSVCSIKSILTLTKPAIRMSRIWNLPIPIASTASDNVKVSSSFSEIQKY